MGFLKSKTTISITLPVDAATAASISPDIETLITNLTAEELSMLAKAVQKPIIKQMAFKELKKYI